MADQVLIAHTGQRLQLDFAQLTSLDEFRAFVTRETAIPSDCIITLTPQGKPLRLAAFQTEKELYVYDARMAQPDAAGAAVANLELPLPKKYTAPIPPNDLRDQRSLAAWQELFHTRQKWASAVVDDCAVKAETAHERYSEMDAMMRCLDAAVANLEAVVKGVETKYTDVKKWIGSAQADYAHLVDKWEQYLDIARNIPISAAMLQFMTGQDRTVAPKGKNSRQQAQVRATLEDLVDVETARKAGKLAPAALRRFMAKVAELERTAPRLLQGCEDVLRGFEQTVDGSAMSHEGEAAQLLQDIRAVASKIETDYQTTLEYTDDSARDILQASKIAATHTERLLPSLRNRAAEMDEMFRYAMESRNRLAAESVDFMRTITELTLVSSTVKSQMGALGGEEDMAHFDYLRLVQQIPFVYASFVSEAIKRREWLDKVRTDSSTLANEMSVFRDEEVKRRRKWQKSVGSLEYGPTSTRMGTAATAAGDNQVVGLEVNLLGEEAEWPAVTRRELEEYFSVLQRQQAETELIEDIGKLMGELRAPTKQQSKRIKAFRNGSVHEAALGRSGLMIRGDDDVLRSLQDDKARVEGKLRTAESRVRRLEDLLHRQSQASRASMGSGALFQQSGEQRAESRGGEHNRRTSAEGGGSSMASTAAAAAAAAAATELRAAQQRMQQLEGELAAERERTSSLSGELAAEKQQTDALEGDLAVEREQRGSLEGELAAKKEQIDCLERERTAAESKTEEANSTKKDLLKNLEGLERGFAQERRSLEEEIRRLQGRIEDAEDEMEHERAAFEEQTRALQGDVARLEGEAAEQQEEVRTQRESSEVLEGELRVVKEEVKAAKEQQAVQVQLLRKLHERMDGTNSEADSTKLAEAMHHRLDEMLSQLQTATEAQKKAEARASTLADELTAEMKARQCQAGNVDEELRTTQEELQTAQTTQTRLSSQLEGRTRRAREVSQRLGTQTERLIQLLERLGFMVSREEGKTVIQRVPRAERSGMLVDGSGPSKSTGAQTDWTDDDADSEARRFDEFLATTSSVDTEAFAEAVYRRVKEVEHIGRKLQRDVRSYRDKAHGLQKEAHDKIAFRQFKEGDLALFLPTRNQSSGAWAAFNVGFPHYFLREQEAHRLQNREWLVARIQRVQERVVDLSGGRSGNGSRSGAEGATEEDTDTENDNPFDLSDGLRWYLIDAQEDKPGAPATPGLGKSTVAGNNVEATAAMAEAVGLTGSGGSGARGRVQGHGRGSGSGSGDIAGISGISGSIIRSAGIEGVSKTLSRSLESRRSSTSSRRGGGGPGPSALRVLTGGGGGNAIGSAPGTATSEAETARNGQLSEVRSIVDSLMGPT
ncbi:taz1-interacting factor 1 [Grosmannia clavigera kw1407]|uniref:Autophagy-related protein 11 n=1 Tax=Grosmannia clavigera (strain kw1407 / UAMH 11150) TaxID=655863 RepID=F0XUY1_GROCL|nr:taz1-interacting factor 1 [Grosmannia clavigera kw1407]EFW99040.1 taz1-interacting factor 1 [Grosmannia clavigera kw1407]